MNYENIIEILLDKNVYNLLKINEEEIFQLLPELKICKGFNQNNKWHIYDVYEHILHVVDKVETNKCLRLAALFHDIGKTETYTEDSDGIGHFYNHWNKSIEIFKKYQDKFILNAVEISLIINLIYYHDINIDKMTNDNLNRLLTTFNKKDIKLLFNLKKADLLSQSPEYHNLIDNINKQEQKILKLAI